MSHANLARFVPHLGCPHQCSFCNQRHITGCTTIPNAKTVHDAVKIATSSKNYITSNAEIAFFGGSFTVIDRNYMCELLEAACEHIKNKSVAGIRVSTRPDCIDESVLTLLKKYGVTSIELGAQSMCDRVLSANNRGHVAEDVVNASKLIKDFGFSLGLQMMTGLYKSSKEEDLYTADKIIELCPDTVRIYPTITLKDTYLERLYLSGDYVPPSLDDAVMLAAIIEDKFEKHSINVIRIGLHSIEEDSYVAGPWHPAFRELCESFKYRIEFDTLLVSGKNYNIYVNPSDVSKTIGQNRSNIDYFNSKNIKLKIIQDNSINKSQYRIEEVN